MMKKTAFMKGCMTLFCAAALVSCSQNPLDKLNSFVNDTVEEAADYTEEQWAEADEKFEHYVNELKTNSENMTSEERKEALKACGTYYGLRAKKGMKSAADEVEKVFESLPALFEGFTEAFEDKEE